MFSPLKSPSSLGAVRGPLIWLLVRVCVNRAASGSRHIPKTIHLAPFPSRSLLCASDYLPLPSLPRTPALTQDRLVTAVSTYAYNDMIPSTRHSFRQQSLGRQSTIIIPPSVSAVTSALSTCFVPRVSTPYLRRCLLICGVTRTDRGGSLD